MSPTKETPAVVAPKKTTSSPAVSSPIQSRSSSGASERSSNIVSPRTSSDRRPANSPLPPRSAADHPTRPTPPRPKSARVVLHSRSASVPSVKGGAFPPLQTTPTSSEIVEREDRRIGPSVSARVSTFSSGRARSGTAAESDFFKPFSETKPGQHPSPPKAGSSRTLHLKLSKSTGFVLDDGLAGALAPPSGAGSPRSPTTLESTAGSHRGTSPRGDELKDRIVYINNPERTFENFPMADNKVRTSKYTILSFLPRNLFEQFHRVAYIYFLVIVVLNQIPQLAVFGRTASLFPLVFVLVITAIKDAYEDWGRHRSDKKENNRESPVFQNGRFEPKKWMHIRVGEMVMIHANQTVPCDMVLLSSSDPSGLAYVQTLNLDGESNLKSRSALPETYSKHPEAGPIGGKLICETPNRNIYGFTAYMDLGDGYLPLGPQNIILRGCEVKNTSWVVGVAVYAGRETKAMLNSSGTQSKRSRLEQQMNRETLWLGVFLLIICLVGGVGMGLWIESHSDLDDIPFYRKRNYEDQEDYEFYGSVGEAVFGFLSCIIVFQIMVPISLYISMELVRLGQAYFMIRDIEMYGEATDSPFQCRALNINEDLGQIKYVFSDKTGTLTENKMEFFSASIDGVDYSDAKVSLDPGGRVEGPSEAVEIVEDAGRLARVALISEEEPSRHWINSLAHLWDSWLGRPAAVLGKRTWKPKVGAKVDPNLVRVLQNSISSEEKKGLHEYFLVLAACNTVVPTRVSVSTSTGQLEMQAASSEEGAGMIEYQGESPDEQALVIAAASYGYTLLERTPRNIAINILGETHRYDILGVHEFDSIRKRMSVIIKCPDGTIKLLVKGADTTVLGIVGQSNLKNLSSDEHQSDVQLSTLSHLDRYAREGLRTLVVASKDLDEKVLDKWRVQYTKASSAIGDRGGMLRAAAEVVEKNLTLLGATGIEDKLQEGVPETIAKLREAGIQVWVLTGDKQETAISIGFSCLLLTRDMHQIVINEKTMDGCKEALASARAMHGIRTAQKKGGFFKRVKRTVDSDTSVDVSTRTNPVVEDQHSELLRRSGQQLALIIGGDSLVHCLSEDLEQELYDLARACKVVVCCRVAPLQKAGVVSLIKRKAKELTLAIGDGANDVSMIQMADVGVGISGQEGRQAVMASDFAMGQFRFLKRLLLVHGHWNYARLGYMVLYNFYRNSVFVMMLFWFILYTAFSPQSAVSDWNLVFYSLIYSSVPTIVVGILDKDLSHKTLLNHPALYRAGHKNLSYSQSLFWAFMLDTLWQSLVLFYVPFFSYRHTTVDIWGLGSLWTIAVVILVTLYLAMDIQRWTYIHHIAIWGSILATWICMFVMDALQIEGLHYWVIYHMVTEWSYWFDLLLILGLALLPRFCVKVFWQQFFPSDIQVAREAEIMGHGGDKVEQGVELNEVPHSPESPPPLPPLSAV